MASIIIRSSVLIELERLPISREEKNKIEDNIIHRIEKKLMEKGYRVIKIKDNPSIADEIISSSLQ